MCTIEEVRTAKKKMRELMDELGRGGAADPDLGLSSRVLELL
jgi:hypothetical protein